MSTGFIVVAIGMALGIVCGVGLWFAIMLIPFLAERETRYTETKARFDERQAEVEERLKRAREENEAQR